MNREDILRMGRQAGAFIELAQEKDLLWLERFASLVASAEREACAELTDSRCQCGGLIQSRGQA
jgi:hypothetical protein